MNVSSYARPLCVALVLAIVQAGCPSATTVGEHSTQGEAEAIVVRPTWTDGGGVEHLVGGIACTLHGPGGKQVTGTTDGKNALVFQDLEPGAYELTLNAHGIESVREHLELRAETWANVLVQVQATEKPAQPGPRTSRPAGHDDQLSASTAAGEGAIFFFKAVGTVLLCVTLIGLVLLVASVDSSPHHHHGGSGGHDDEDCERH